MNGVKEISSRMPPEIGNLIEGLPAYVTDEIEEIRLRCGQKIQLKCGSRERILEYIVEYEELKKILNRLLQFSYYAYEDDLARGFITIQGGHRIGICGKSVSKKGEMGIIREVSSVNIRFAREIKGCSGKVLPKMFKERMLLNTLIVSPPGCGKTTLLRDVARALSEYRMNVAICDERTEIAGMYNGRPGFDLGPRCDILDGCRKADGIPVLIRAMAPDVIITDEIGLKEDISPIMQCLTSGVKLITSVHGNSMDDLKKSAVGQLMDGHVFQCFVFLSNEKGVGTVREIIYA